MSKITENDSAQRATSAGATSSQSAVPSAGKTDVEGSQSETRTTAAETVVRAARDGVEAAKETAESQFDAAKSELASGTHDAASRVRRAGESFDTDSFAHAAADRIADNLSYAAEAVRSTDLASLQSDLSAFARRNPLAFFGGAAVLGFLAGRLVKASEITGRADDYAVRESASYAASRGGVAGQQHG